MLLLQNGDKVEVLPIAEIDFNSFAADQPRIVDYSAKWLADSFAYNNTPRIIPAKLSEATAKKVRQCALGAWNVIGCQDYARVDFRLDGNDNVYILEVNPNPDISPDAGFAAAIVAGGVSYDKFIDILLNNAVTRLTQKSGQNGKSPLKTAKTNRKSLTIRRISAEDRDMILSILEKTEFFRPNELKIAEEVLDDSIAKGPGGDYQSFTAVDNGKVVGWICFGQTPCTLGTFDVYWVAVAPEQQGSGIGAELMSYITEIIKNKDGRLIVVETSGLEKYVSTQKFYEKLGYRVACRVKDFYAAGDDKLIYTKYL